ncbi:MAG: XAC0095 family protein [Dyella sp.]|uniref:XAC0095 family protein n=1 Tax=Dyella sp. TaxID=1869338 RepID=UPI003F7CECF2
MSTIDSEDLEGAGEVLSAHSLQRLAKLRLDVALLARLVRKRQAKTPEDVVTEIHLSEIASNLVWLETHIAQVLDERLAQHTSSEAGASGEADATEPAGDEADERYMSGITLDQLDAIHELLDSLRAHGDVVNCSGEAEFADGTLPAIGDAIYRDAGKLREVIDVIDAQRLGLSVGMRASVQEEGATYVAFPACLPANVVASAVQAHPTFQ